MVWAEGIFVLLVLWAIALIVYAIYKLFSGKFKEKESKKKYPSRYKCLDGDIVRSLSELLIDNYFFRKGIHHKYEDRIPGQKDSHYKYDWFLPEKDIYVEFFGYHGKKYQRTREKKEKFYRKEGLKLISIVPGDLSNLEETLPEKFGKEWAELIHPKHCPNCGYELDDRI